MKMRLLLIAFIVFGAILPSKLWAVDLHDFVIVTDIDDTIRNTLNRHDGKTLEFLRNLILNRAFIGASPLLHQLQKSGAEIIYVSGAPKLIGPLPRRFLRAAEFPIGELSLRDSMRESIEDSKYERLSAIMRANPDKTFVLIGDNGERDIPTFERLQKTADLAPRIKMVLVHKMYGPGVGLELRAGQIPYLTSADLAMRLYTQQIVSLEELKVILTLVVDNLDHPSQLVRENDLPHLDQVEASDLPFVRNFVQQQGLDASARDLAEEYFEHLGRLLKSEDHSLHPSFIPICRRLLSSF